MRNRFEPPTGDLNDPAFVKLYIAAGITDSADRMPNDVDEHYWGVEKKDEMIAHGVAINHPHYFFHRILGLYAEGADAPRYGPYAQPPNSGPAAGWTTPFIDVGVVDPPGPSEPPPVPRSILDALAVSQAALDRLEAKVDQVLARKAPKYRAPIPANSFGVAGTIVLTPDSE